MAKTVEWPPTPVNGRIRWVEGVKATQVSVILTLSDLQTNPFNPVNLSLGDITFISKVSAGTKIQNAMERLRSILLVESITSEEVGETGMEYTVEFVDRETQQRSEVKVNG